MRKPPLGQERACSTVKVAPQTQNNDVYDGGHPYLSDRASVKALLCRQKPNSSIGNDVSQLEASHSQVPLPSSDIREGEL